jgi:phosphoheptose isomerase
MNKKYGQFGLELHTDDESDACVVFDYWYEDVFKNMV